MLTRLAINPVLPEFLTSPEVVTVVMWLLLSDGYNQAATLPVIDWFLCLWTHSMITV